MEVKVSRPKKATVDYFPHNVSSGRTMFILEQSYGNDGYSFWFKLLEILGGTENHFFDFNDPASREFLLAKTRVNEFSARDILSLLAKLHAIDPELWEQKIIWCQNFVNGISDAYRKRSMPIPTKEGLFRLKLQDSGISSAGNPTGAGNIPPEIRKGEESIVKESKGEEIRFPAPEIPTPEIPPETRDQGPDKKQVPENCLRLARYLLTKIRDFLPNFKEPNLNRWGRDFDLMIRQDKRETSDILKTIDFATADAEFWQGVILSADKVRKHFDKLAVQMQLPGRTKGDDKKRTCDPRTWEPRAKGVPA
jgi:hypothetical protein